MNIPTILYVCLFIPFVILFAIFGTTFMKAGYKKGLGSSLVSFGATVIAILVGLGLSKLVAGGLSIPITTALKNLIPNDNAMTSAFLGGSLQGIVKIVLSFFFFAIFFPIALGVLKSVLTKRINLDKLNKTTDKSSLGGLGVRFVDALLVVLMLSLPFYGTIAMVAPPIASFAAISLSENQTQSSGFALPTSTENSNGINISNMNTTTVPDEEMLENYFQEYLNENEPVNPPQSNSDDDYLTVLNTVADHPILIPYKYGPAEWVYSGLSSFSMNGKPVDIARATEVMNGLIDRIMTFINLADSSDDQEVLDAVEEIVSYTRDNVIEERWFYNMFMALIGEFDKAVAENTIDLGDDEQFVNQFRPLFDMSYSEFKSNGIALLDFIEYMLRDKPLDVFSHGRLSYEETLIKADEFLAIFGALINHSEQAAAAKQLIYMFAISDEFSTNNVDAVFANWGDGLLTEPNEQKADATMFLALESSVSRCELLQLMAINPLFGGEAASQLITEDSFAELTSNSFYYYEYYDEIEALVRNDKSIIDDLKAKLISYEQTSVFESSYFDGPNDFEDYVVNLVGEKLNIDLEDFTNSSSSAFFKMGEDGKIYVTDEYGNVREFDSIFGDSITSSSGAIAIL